MIKKGILFDMDGTLINTFENINYKQALCELKAVQKTLLMKIFKPRIHSLAEMEERILQVVEDPIQAHDLIRRVYDFLFDHYDNAPLKKDALTFLQYLKQKDYKICLCTNNATEIVGHILKEKHLEDYFDYVITSQQVEHSKPNPQMYLQALQSINLKAEECIVFEDNEHGIMAARNAGIDVIVVNAKEKRKYSDARMTICDYGDERLYEEF